MRVGTDEPKQRGAYMEPVLILLISVVFASAGQIFMKKGMSIVGEMTFEDIFSTKLVSALTQPQVLIGISSYLVSSVLYLAALSNLDVSYAYPLIGVGYILVALLASLFFCEAITLARWAGILLIVAGAILITQF